MGYSEVLKRVTTENDNTQDQITFEYFYCMIEIICILYFRNSLSKNDSSENSRMCFKLVSDQYSGSIWSQSEHQNTK